MASEITISKLYTFRSAKWKKAALTHSSLPKGEKFERLEFLGDRILGAVVAEWLYLNHPQAREGELSKRSSELVSRGQCARIAKAIGIADELVCASRIDLKSSAVLGNALEAWLGAIFQDGGFDAAREVILKLWEQFDKPEVSDYKTRLQEWVQQRQMPLPVYEVVLAEGPDHRCVYTVAVNVPPHELAEGKGSSRK